MVLKLKEKQIYTVPQKNNRTQDSVSFSVKFVRKSTEQLTGGNVPH